ncbi:MAG TPA: sorbosone dehydrogenase family protein [Candidatus Acidoferrales bacterium]|nr:sorbosone dehydrogenase family protein [Candidatus Acidoferrales bacterium]
MRRLHQGLAIAFCLLLVLLVVSRREYAGARNDASANPAAAASPFTDFHGEMPGNIHHITAADLPAPYATKSAAIFSRPVPKPADVWPQAPAGFKVAPYAENLKGAPRTIITAPNGDLFVAATNQGEILVFRGVTSDGKPQQLETFATGLRLPFGLAFYPRGPNPQYLYVGDTDAVIRFPYKNGDLKATGPHEVIVPNLPAGPNHFARGVAFSLDGKQMFISVGSHTNVTDVDTDKSEFHRADILVANPDGSDLSVFASGIRNGSGIAVNPDTGELWTSVNERDELGDNLPPDYITHVQEGGFYGWPWYYIGGNQDPRFAGKHPELKDKTIVPDVLMEPHNASLNITFYEGKQFPKEFKGQLFAAEHGSWNRSVRTGYEVVLVPMKNGHATGQYEDFLTGFVLPDGNVWGRPVGVAVAQDGSLMVTDDGSNSIWRVTHGKK